MSHQTLALYKQLMREASHFPAYNFKMYTMRRIRDAFKANKSLTDEEAVKTQLDFARQNLNIIKRQVQIGHLYTTEKLVIEK